MARKLKPAIELLSNIGSLGFDLQHHSDADIAEAMAFMRQANGPMFDYLAERLAPPPGDATPPQTTAVDCVHLFATIHSDGTPERCQWCGKTQAEIASRETPPLAERLTDDTLDAAYEAFWSECDDVAGPPSEQTGPTLQKARSAMRAVLLAALTPRQE
jgi:hypothetical protein